MRTKDEDFVANLFVASTHSYILIFTRPRAGLLAEGARDPGGRAPGQGQGRSSTSSSCRGGEKIAALCAVKAFDAGGHVLLATRKGIVKKTPLRAFSNPRTGGIIALRRGARTTR